VIYFAAAAGWALAIIFWSLYNSEKWTSKMLREVSDFWLETYRQESKLNGRLIEALVEDVRGYSRSSIQSPDRDRQSTPSRGPESTSDRSAAAAHQNRNR
jgi:hypothetical protein